jgi:hypothetical protein
MKLAPQTYFLIRDFALDLQILKTNLQLFAINLLNIGGGLKRIGQSGGANFMTIIIITHHAGNE